MDKNYQIELCYGYEEGEYGVSLEFEVVDPSSKIDRGLIGNQLAEALDVTSDDYHFTFGQAYFDLPESLVAKIKGDAVKEYLAKEAQKGKGVIGLDDVLAAATARSSAGTAENDKGEYEVVLE